MNKFISYAQNCEDVMLWRALQHVPNGRYMDVGANHPSDDSVTKAFYERGWRGVNVEPIRSLHGLLQLERPHDINLCCGISSRCGKAMFHEVVGAEGLSTLDNVIANTHVLSGREIHSYEIPVETISSLCAMHQIDEIHFLKIDVEGAEQAVLQ
jgi:FkbM family methyltransferase